MKKLRELAMNQEGFAFDPRTGESYYLNSSACEVIEYLRTGDSEEVAAKKIAEKYELNLESAFEDVHDLILQLKIFNLVD